MLSILFWFLIKDLEKKNLSEEVSVYLDFLFYLCLKDF